MQAGHTVNCRAEFPKRCAPDDALRTVTGTRRQTWQACTPYRHGSPGSDRAGAAGGSILWAKRNDMVSSQFRVALCLCLLASACGGGGDTRSADGSASPAPAPAAASPGTPPAASPPQAAVQTGPDPLYGQQWHLKNTGQRSAGGAIATAGEDLDVEPVWAACGDSGTCRGEGVTIAVVDRSVEIRHQDLQQNLSTSLSSRVCGWARPSRTGRDWGTPRRRRAAARHSPPWPG